MKVEIIVKVKEDEFSWSTLAESTITICSSNPANISVGAAVDEMLPHIVREARENLLAARRIEQEKEQSEE